MSGGAEPTSIGGDANLMRGDDAQPTHGELTRGGGDELTRSDTDEQITRSGDGIKALRKRSHAPKAMASPPSRLSVASPSSP